MADYTVQQYRDAAKKALAAGDVASANELIAAGQALEASTSKTNIVEQVGSGTSEGIAGALGAPVDLMTGALNLGARGINAVAGTNLPPIENPVGGSSAFQKLMEPFVSDVAPQTAGQRYGRRIGQELGFDAVAAPVSLLAPGIGAAARANLPAYAAGNIAGDVGAGVAGQTAREIAPESDAADFWASLLGGGIASGAVAGMTPAYGPVPTRDGLAGLANDKWAAVKAAPERLTDQATSRLASEVQGSLPTSQLAPSAYPTAFKMAGETGNLKNPSVYDVAELRRLFGDAVASDPKESRVGVGMKRATEDFLNRLDPNDVTGGDPAATVANMRSANELSSRVHRYDTIANKEMRGERRAATAGTGGNEVNAKRQNIGAVLDKERDPTLRGKRQGFTPEEVKQMERIVYGTDWTNNLRRFGKLAPTSGALPMLATGWGGAAGVAAASTGAAGPLAAIPALAGGVGFAAKALAESTTEKEIQKLLDIIASGGQLKPSSAREASKAAVLQQLLSSALSGGMPQ